MDQHETYLAAFATEKGISVEEAGVWMSAMTQIIDTIGNAARSSEPAAYNRFESFGLGTVDVAGDPIRMMAELADMAITAVGLLTQPPYPSFDTKGYARRVAACFGQPGWQPGQDPDLTAVPVAWWQTPLGRLAGRVLRGGDGPW